MRWLKRVVALVRQLGEQPEVVLSLIERRVYLLELIVPRLIVVFLRLALLVAGIAAAAKLFMALIKGE